MRWIFGHATRFRNGASMSNGEEFICNPPSAPEIEGRLSRLREHMRERGVDAVVTQGSNGYAGAPGYFRWLTGMPALNSFAQTAIIPVEGLMTLVHPGNFGGDYTLDGAAPEFRGFGRRRTTPIFPAVSYGAAYDGEIAARHIKEHGYRTVGLVGAFSMYHGFVAALTSELPDVKFVDMTEPVDRLKAIKSPEDVDFIRRTAAMQDDMMSKVHAHIRPGMKDFEIAAYAQYVGQMHGSEGGYILCSSAPPGKAAPVRHRSYQGRTLREGDVFMFQCENAGPGGFVVHVGRMFVLGKASQELMDAFGAMVEAQRYTVGLLEPGASCSAVFAEYNAYMRARGLPEEARLHAHGQGYENVERPLVRQDESMNIEANMNIGVHPVLSNSRMYVTVTDNFLTRADGMPERLHTTPQQVFEL
jgi:Xaa-Pro aminopeptidase